MTFAICEQQFIADNKKLSLQGFAILAFYNI